MAIVERSIYQGPNPWSSRPVVHVLADASDAGPDAVSRLRLAMRQDGLDAGADENGGLWDSVGSIIAGIALEMQRSAGDRVSFCISQPGVEPGTFDVVVECRDAVLAEAALDLTVRLLSEILEPGQAGFDFEREFERTIRRIVEARPVRPQEDAVIRAAEERRIPIRWVAPPSLLIELGTGIHLLRYRDMITSHSSHLGDSISTNKEMTLRLLGEVGIPVPRSIPVTSEDEAVSAAEQLGFPVVVKPLSGSQGRGLGVDLRTPEKVREFYPIAARATRSGKVLVEQLIEGAENRVLVIGGKVVAVLERMPAHVVGDGVHTVAELIDIVNQDPLRGRGHTQILTDITPDAATTDALERVGMTLESVPPAGQYVRVKLVSNVSQGGTTRDRTDDIHPDNAHLAVLAARTIDVDPCGVDLITPDITKSVWETGGGIIEINHEPGPRVHLVPQIGKPRDIGAAVVDSLFPPGTPVRIPVVAVLGNGAADEIATAIWRQARACGITAGLATTSANVVGHQSMTRLDLQGRTHHRLVLHNPFAELAVLQVEMRDLEPPGLLFRYCDVVVLPDSPGESRGAHRAAARVVLDLMPPDGSAIVDVDAPGLEDIRSSLPNRVIGFGVDPESELLQQWRAQGGEAVFVRDDIVVHIREGVERSISAPADLSLPALGAAIALELL
ncbi:MAG: ATP-grasp domain-containing protein [Thermomicrobiales bacterium]|nr:ATP-grasp domain-containing protein [Thermomicrobiales bacterium]